MLKIRRSRDRLIFNTGIPTHGKDGLYIETGPSSFQFILNPRVKLTRYNKIRVMLSCMGQYCISAISYRRVHFGGTECYYIRVCHNERPGGFEVTRGAFPETGLRRRCLQYILIGCLPGTSWWRHQMETLSALLAICAGNSPVNSRHKGQWRGALKFSLICAWINGWVNNLNAGDLRRHCTHYDVTVMTQKHDDAHLPGYTGYFHTSIGAPGNIQGNLTGIMALRRGNASCISGILTIPRGPFH